MGEKKYEVEILGEWKLNLDSLEKRTSESRVKKHRCTVWPRQIEGSTDLVCPESRSILREGTFGAKTATVLVKQKRLTTRLLVSKRNSKAFRKDINS